MALDNTDPSQHGFPQGSLIYNCEPSVRREIINAMYRIGDPHSYERFWNQILTGDEREQLGGGMESAFVDARSAINQLSRIRNWPPERAILEISYRLGGMLEQDYARLLSDLGFQAPTAANSSLDVPSWDPDTGQLSFRGRVCRSISNRATSIRPILTDFQNAGWPSSLRSVAVDSVNPNKIDDLVSSLNTNLDHIEFSRSGGAILWYPTPS